MPDPICRPLEFHVIGVRSGASLLVMAPNGKTVLIDAANKARKDATAINKILTSNGITDIDIGVATHGDKDHIGGWVMGHRYEKWGVDIPDTVYHPNTDFERTNLAGQFLALLKGERIEIGSEGAKKIVNIGNPTTLQEIYNKGGIDLGCGARMHFISANGYFVRPKTDKDPKDDPKFVSKESEQAPYTRDKDPNSRSICTLVEQGAFQFFSCGDLPGKGKFRTNKSELAELSHRKEKHGEAIVAGAMQLLYGKDPGVDVILPNHHGTGTSTVATYLEALNPEVAIISSGSSNSFGHPHVETLRRLIYGWVRRVDGKDVFVKSAVDVYLTSAGKKNCIRETDEGFFISCNGKTLMPFDAPEPMKPVMIDEKKLFNAGTLKKEGSELVSTPGNIKVIVSPMKSKKQTYKVCHQNKCKEYKFDGLPKQ